MCIMCHTLWLNQDKVLRLLTGNLLDGVESDQAKSVLAAFTSKMGAGDTKGFAQMKQQLARMSPTNNRASLRMSTGMWVVGDG